MERKRNLQIFLAIVALIVIYCLIQKFGVIASAISYIFGVFSPIILGFVVAFVLNLPMRGLERRWDMLAKRLTRKRSKKPNKVVVSNDQSESIEAKPHKERRSVSTILRRPVCLLLSIVIIFVLISILVAVVFPEIGKAIVLIVNEAPGYLTNLRDWAMGYVDEYPAVRDFLANLEIDWQSVAMKLFGTLAPGTIGAVGVTFGYVMNALGGVLDFIIALIFAIYVLLCKETLERQVKALMDAFLSEKVRGVILHISGTSHRIFSSFVTGQCLEAFILGGLCIIGMALCRFPYAMMIGTLVGATALIPVVGAFIGAGVGAFLIMMQDPFQALMFLLFIVILQQIEGNVIYPKVVGTSVGLPAMWVLAAVTVGAGLNGIVGMLFAVPTASVLYTLLREYTAKRLKKKVTQGEVD